jgi:hypothetical protein
MKTLKKIGLFIKKHYKNFLFLFVFIGLFFAVIYGKDNIQSLFLAKRKLIIARKQKEISDLSIQRELIKVDLGTTAAQIQESEKNIRTIDRKIAKIKKEVKEKLLAQKLDRLNELGYK